MALLTDLMDVGAGGTGHMWVTLTVMMLLLCWPSKYKGVVSVSDAVIL